MDKFVCYEHFSFMDPKCFECPDKKECAIETMIRKEQKYGSLYEDDACNIPKGNSNDVL